MAGIVAKTGSGVQVAAAFGQWLRQATCKARHRIGKAARAHDRRRQSKALGDETQRDTGLAPETATGQRRWQGDLPFFMQSGFGRR